MNGNMEKCNVCNGVGKVAIPTISGWLGVSYTPCPKCKGLMLLDWVEMIVGVDESRIVKVIKKGTISSGPR